MREVLGNSKLRPCRHTSHSIVLIYPPEKWLAEARKASKRDHGGGTKGQERGRLYKSTEMVHVSLDRTE